MKLEFIKYQMPSANLGELSSLPDIHNNAYIRSSITLTDNVKQKDRKYIGQGMISTLLPYKTVDGYDRSRNLKDFDAVVLENEYLKALFIPELGGRLWSLFDKKNNRELLYKNNVFQPANLALRNAWFSGGVEWNVGIKGHNPLTCSPMFAKKAYNADGTPILKMYEYERIRGVVYALYATLKEDVLLIKVCIENTKNEYVPMYWWSNIAVPETKDTRTIVPATETFFCGYENGGYILDYTDLPTLNGADITYATNSKRSRDFFFNIPDGEDKWIATIDEKGKGLLQYSTDELAGRKMFVWGTQSGGRHWNEWLSDCSKPYIEIQAGILKTQLEHFPMEPNSTISFIEGYSGVSANPKEIHDADYKRSSKEVAKIVKDKKKLLDESIFEIKNEEPLVYYGSGWGALENLSRGKSISNYCDFPNDSMDEEQEDWLRLLKGMPTLKRCVGEQIPSYVTGEKWKELLSKQADKDWYVYLQLGVINYALGEYGQSKDCFVNSIKAEENGWAYRNLAQIKGNIEGDYVGAASDMEKSADLLTYDKHILAETATALIKIGEYGRWIQRYNNLPQNLQSVGRLKMLTGQCYVRLQDVDNARKYINRDLVVYDMKEGDHSASEIWAELYSIVLAKELGVSVDSLSKEQVMQAYPLPFELDFRMH